MKKYFEIIIALLMVIGVTTIPNDVHAMTTQNLSGHIYKVTDKTKYDDDSVKGSRFNYYWIFGNNNQVLITQDRNTVKFIKSNKTLLDSMIESQNNYREKEAYNYTFDGNALKVTTDKGKMLADTTVSNYKINKCTVAEDDDIKNEMTFKEVK